MKVVFVTRSAHLEFALELIGALTRDVEVHLIVETSPEGRSGPLGELPRFEREGVHETGAEWLSDSLRARVRGLASVHFASFDRKRAFHPANALVCLQAARLIRRLRPDLVHFDDATTRLFSLLYMLGRVPVALTVHNPLPFMGERAGRFEMVRRRFVARARLLMFHSEHSRRAFVARSPVGSRTHTMVVRLGIFDTYRELCEPVSERPGTVLFFGRIGLYKGIDVLFEAAPSVADSVGGVRFVIAGQPSAGGSVGPPPPLPNGGTWEVFERLVLQPEMCRLFQQAAVVVLPYRQAWQSGVVSTAFGFGKPVVATAVGGIPEVVADGVTGRLVPPGDPVALAGALTEVLEDEGLRARMKEAIAAEAAGPLSWESLAAIVLDGYRRTLGLTS